jgi:membrane-associated phospholipid phosphatase
MASPNDRLQLLSLAALFVVIFVALGLTFARRPWVGVDDFGAKASGNVLPLAIAFTRSGYSPALTIVAIVSAAIVILLRASLGGPAAIVVLQLIGQLCAGAAKRIVARLRPEVWHFRQELGFAYPSGHAVTALFFYPGLAAIAQGWPIPGAAKAALLCLAALWAIGIGWSRLALGAHRLTDVLGGYALGAARLCVCLALFA